MGLVLSLFLVQVLHGVLQLILGQLQHSIIDRPDSHFDVFVEWLIKLASNLALLCRTQELVDAH